MAGEGERREGGEGRSAEEEFAEFVEYLKEKYPEGGIKDEDSAGRPHEKDSAQSENSAEDSSKSAQGNHAEQPDENEVEEGDARKLETNNEGGRDEEFERLWERIKKRLESQAADERHGLDQERRNSGNGPPEERTPDDVRGEPKAPSERLSREPETGQNPESGGRGERVEGNRTDKVESSQSQPYRDENIVSSREIAHANEELRPTREALQGRIDPGPVLTAARLEHRASNAADAGDQREAGKEPIGIVDSALFEDLKALRRLQSDGALPEKILGNEVFYRKEIVDLDKVTEPSEGGKETRFVGDTARIESDSRPYVRYAHKGPFEVGDSIPVKANLTGVPPHIRLDVLKSHIESVAGVEIDRYKLYEIKGSVKGAYEFDVYRTVGKYVYLSPSLEQRDKVQPGRVYDVGIKSVVEVPLTDAQREILGGPKKRGAW